MSNFYVGQKVVCVNSDMWPELRVGQVYTVFAIDQCCTLWIALNELGSDGNGHDNCPICGSQNPQIGHDLYCATFFRPVQETDQSEDLTRELATQLLERIVHEELEQLTEQQPAAQ
jgi:hypothetical protein